VSSHLFRFIVLLSALNVGLSITNEAAASTGARRVLRLSGSRLSSSSPLPSFPEHFLEATDTVVKSGARSARVVARTAEHQDGTDQDAPPRKDPSALSVVLFACGIAYLDYSKVRDLATLFTI
jgi:hypothetical protein